MKVNAALATAAIVSVFALLAGCTTTVDVEKNANTAETGKNIPSDDESLTDEEYLVSEEMKESDVSPAAVFIENPSVIMITEPESAEPVKIGDEALKQNMADKLVLPEYRQGHLRAWRYEKGKIYQIHTQTYHSTVIQLEPGEKLAETPYLSETDVWQYATGILPGEPQTQYLIIKPDYSGLTSTLTLITTRRLYLIELKSFKDHYMPFVQWVYPDIRQNILPAAVQSAQNETAPAKEAEIFSGVNAEYLSFNYKIRRSIFRKPTWCPELVYDDGKRTYIVLDKTVLHQQMPTVFSGKKEIINKEFHKNVIIINELIEKVTVRLGKEKVEIIKKRGTSE